VTISRISKGILLLALFFAAVGIARADSLFTFESDAVGTTTTFSNTVSGITATFSSTSDPGGFEVFDFLGLSSISGNSLAQGPSAPNGLPLSIAFSTNVDSISLNFGLDDTGSLTLTAFEGLIPVGTVTVIGVIPPGFSVPEGFLTFNGAAFNSVVLSSSTASSSFFDVGNIDVKSIVVPEPATLTLLAAGFVGLIARSRKLHSSRASL
jgi:hypothetical protein